MTSSFAGKPPGKIVLRRASRSIEPLPSLCVERRLALVVALAERRRADADAEPALCRTLRLLRACADEPATP